MKKLGVVIILLLFTIKSSFAQDSNALKLVKLLHGEEITEKTAFLKEISEDSLKLESSVAMLYKNLSEAYNKEFTSKEIFELVKLYTTPLGEKLLKNGEAINALFSNEIYKWEAKQQGIDIEEENIDLLISNPAEIEIPLEEDPTKPQSPPKELTKTVRPEVKTLDDLRTMIKSDETILYDSWLMAELLDLEAVLNPPLEEIVPEEENENKKQ